MFIEQLNRRMEEHMILGLEEEDFVFSYVLAATSFSSSPLYMLKNPSVYFTK